MITLSGGEMGGMQVERDDWQIGETRQVGTSLYRLDSDTQATYCGEVQP